ncbi:uncharacterized protein [Miscanthus floridulus]|uniref:uncharacterized protein n=1 Tax=Miscanthus floridulus TaxID=154761 RepID=UPI00345B08B4
MDGGSGLNIMYAKTLDEMGVDQTNLRPIQAPFHGIVPGRVITIGTSFQRAYECEVECCGHASVVIASEELATLREKVVEEAPDAKKSTRSFELVEGSREVLLDPSSSEGKKVRIGTTLSSE